MLDNLYKNIGNKIKTLAKWIFIVETIAAIITGLVLLFTDENLILYGFLTLFCGPIVAWVSSWILYAFGELAEDIHAIRGKYYSQAEEKVNCKTEEIIKQATAERTKQEAEEVNLLNVDMRKKAYTWDHWNEEDSSIGQCELCAKKHQGLLFVEFEDSDGKHQKNICFNCFSERDCKPIRHMK